MRASRGSRSGAQWICSQGDFAFSLCERVTAARRSRLKSKTQPMEQQTDNEILARVAQGDTEAFGVLVGRYTDRIYALAVRITGDREAARDVVQEAFIRAYDRLKGFRGACAFSSWLFRIAYNLSIDRCRRERRRPTVRLTDGETRIADRPETEGPYDAEHVERMRRALDRLTAEERAMVTLYYEEERPVAEIAAIVGISESNAKVRLHRVRQRIRRYMEEEK